MHTTHPPMNAAETAEARALFAAELARLGCTAGDVLARAERVAWAQYRNPQCWGARRPAKNFTLTTAQEWLWGLAHMSDSSASAVRDLYDRQHRARWEAERDAERAARRARRAARRAS